MIQRKRLLLKMKYQILIDNKIVAERMNIEIALTLVKALFEKYYNDHSMTISIKEEELTSEGKQNDNVR